MVDTQARGRSALHTPVLVSLEDKTDCFWWWWQAALWEELKEILIVFVFQNPSPAVIPFDGVY